MLPVASAAGVVQGRLHCASLESAGTPCTLLSQLQWELHTCSTCIASPIVWHTLCVHKFTPSDPTSKLWVSSRSPPTLCTEVPSNLKAHQVSMGRCLEQLQSHFSGCFKGALAARMRLCSDVQETHLHAAGMLLQLLQAPAATMHVTLTIWLVPKCARGLGMRR